MTATARLLGLRLHGFKSFAERTVLDFGPGISAIVGPNGSGKSNLADGLRWALGEQGRSLRSRRSEDVVFAGSDRRSALGMAEVTIVVDNVDGLLPVDYSVVELGRRLYRSGENDYLLNRRPVRLRDLVDLLDAAHLADNAFLFIGQGMVDQALALRPEERRPLFEEVAGVRRHERRRRRAEDQLAEAEANLARVVDIVAELRPRVRRLAAQAEQQTSRMAAGTELVAALLTAAHGRWRVLSATVATTATRRTELETEAGVEREALRAAEVEVARAADAIGDRSRTRTRDRDAHDAARAVVGDLERREAGLIAEVESIDRDRRRLDGERAAIEANLAAERTIVDRPLPPVDDDAAASLASVDAHLAEALNELAAIRSQDAARGEAAASARRVEASRAAEVDLARRRLADAERRWGEAEDLARDAVRRQAEAEENAARVSSASQAARARADASAADAEAAREALAVAEMELGSARASEAAAAERVAAIASRVAAERARLDEDERRPIARIARRHGGRRIDDGLIVDPDLRRAVEAALGEAVRGYIVPRSAIRELARERGLVVDDADEGARRERREAAADAPILAAITRHGGGRLDDAVRADPAGVASRILSSAWWVPDVESLAAIRGDLPPGALAVTRDGAAVADRIAFRFGSPDGVVERRELVGRLEASHVEAVAAAAIATTRCDAAREAVDAARRVVESTRAASGQSAAEAHRAGDEDRIAARTIDGATRDAVWQRAQADRLAGEVERARTRLAEVDDGTARPSPDSGEDDDSTGDRHAIAAWEGRVDELRATRDRLTLDQAAATSERRTAEQARGRAEAAIALGVGRLERLDAEERGVAVREGELLAELAVTRTRLVDARAMEAELRTVLATAEIGDADDRAALAAAERRTVEARERLAALEMELHSVERHEIEARLALDQVRDGLLTELDGLGDVALVGLATAMPTARRRQGGSDESIEPLIDDLFAHWSVSEAPVEGPSHGRIAGLRRRFHDLGGADPSAVEEFAEVSARLASLETQERDLRGAIDETRRLIADLSAMVASQFRATFAALEGAFDRRFRQLFDGGSARLSLTEPGDLTATGVEIVVRPPGKKPGTLAVLSGGERALTAVALLFAMLEVRPVPFCVLDEVDAALDEANVGRFADALRELATQIQVVVITHNRGTIESADALYGVTVGDDSVSRVVSLRLDEATEIARRARSDGFAVAGG